MTTLDALKAEIADDLDRTDLTASIASEIPKAIRHYQNTRFYFNETRDETFATVDGQALYTSTDDSAIPLFIEIDQITLTDGTDVYDLDPIDVKEWELLTASGASSSRPSHWCYFNRSIGLYPIPDAVYTIRMIGHIMKAGPATDEEANNVWMVEAFDLLRARVCSKLGLRKMLHIELAAAYKADEIDELNRLKSETGSRIGTGMLTPTEF